MISGCRIGKFSISVDLINAEPEACRAALEGVIVVRAEMMFVENTIEYIGLHEDFDEVDRVTPPRYWAVMQRTEDGKVCRLSWQREGTAKPAKEFQL